MNAERLLAIDPVRAKFVEKIDKIIRQAEAGDVPAELIEPLKQVRQDYAEGKIASESELEKKIIELAAKTAAHSMRGSYKPRQAAMRAYATMQEIARMNGVTLLEMAKSLGYSCVYEWQQDILKAVGE